MARETESGDIRRKAEAQALADGDPGGSPRDKLIYELKVHQIELEMQNAELQSTQREIQHARRLYETLFDFAPVAYFVLDAEGAILEANHLAASILQTERRYLDHKPFVVFLAKEYHTAFFSHVRRVLDTGHRQATELQIVTRQGDAVWTRVESRRQIDPEGTAQCLSALLDISDRKRMEDDLILARENAESANRSKSVFLADMSHEIRTPMAGILTMSDIALRNATDREQEQYLKAIHAAARSLLAIVDDVVDITRVEQERIALDRSPFRVASLLETVIALFQPNAAPKSLELRIEGLAAVPAVVAGDRNRIRQVLVNLLSNAVRFTESGSVVLRVGSQPISGFLHEFTFEVVDTGPGIAAEEQRRIRNAFSLSGDDDRARYVGSGMGLAIAGRLAHLMGGQLYFDTQEGHGSSFHFTVPLEIPGDDASAEERVPAQPGAVPHEGAPPRILVAEDNAINMLVIRTTLEKAGYDVVSVTNGRDAVERLRVEAVAAVLMDISMPGLDGLAALREIRRADSGIDPALPIIAISAHSMKGDRERFLAAGMTDYIAKPFVRSTILRTIERHIRNINE